MLRDRFDQAQTDKWVRRDLKPGAANVTSPNSLLGARTMRIRWDRLVGCILTIAFRDSPDRVTLWALVIRGERLKRLPVDNFDAPAITDPDDAVGGETEKWATHGRQRHANIFADIGAIHGKIDFASGLASSGSQLLHELEAHWNIACIERACRRASRKPWRCAWQSSWHNLQIT
jgi:hypothetical protein